MNLESINNGEDIIRDKFSQFEAETTSLDWNSMKHMLNESNTMEETSVAQTSSTLKKKALIIIPIFIIALLSTFLWSQFSESNTSATVDLQKKTSSSEQLVSINNDVNQTDNKVLKANSSIEINNQKIEPETTSNTTNQRVIDQNDVTSDSKELIGKIAANNSLTVNQENTFTSTNTKSITTSIDIQQIDVQLTNNKSGSTRSVVGFSHKDKTITTTSGQESTDQVFESKSSDVKGLLTSTDNQFAYSKILGLSMDKLDIDKITINVQNIATEKLPFPIRNLGKTNKLTMRGHVGGRMNNLSRPLFSAYSRHSDMISGYPQTFTAGLSVDFRRNNTYSFSIGANINQFSIKELLYFSEPHTINVEDYNLTWQYRRALSAINALEIPLLISFDPSFSNKYLDKLSFNAGVTGSYLFIYGDKSSEMNQRVGDLSSEAPEGWEAPDTYEGINRFDFGLSIGTELEISSGFSFYAKMNYGFIDIIDNNFWNNNNTFDRNSSIQVGATFNIFNTQF